MIINLYNLFLFSVVFPISLLFYLSNKRRKEMKERLGIVPDYILKNLQNKKCIWMHAASVGEVLSLIPIIKLLNNKVSNYEIIVSTMTKSARNVIKNRIPEIKNYIYIPLDVSICVKKAVNTIKPDVFLMSETEIWPNLLFELKRNGAKILLINGRISKKSFKLYKLVKNTFKKVLMNIDCFNMSSEEDSSRIMELGADKNKIKILGHSKFDINIKKEVLDKINKDFEFIKGKKVIIAGSTHEGEEEIILEVYEKLITEIQNIFLIIAPRHLERLNNVEQLLITRGIKFIKRSELLVDSHFQVILLDTVGELSFIYSLATVSFVGGSLVNIGGHNVIEPAFFEKPVLFGQYTQNFRDITKALMDSGGGIEIKTKEELYSNIKKLLSSDEECRKIGELAKKTIEEYKGGTIKNVSDILAFLN